MQLLLVEKDSRMTSTYVERVLGFDRDTRTVYLSDCNYRNNSNNSSRTAGWKKAMRLYAVRLHCMYNQSVNMRSANCDVRDLLTFTLYGARERTVQQQQQQQQQTLRLPDLRAYIPDTTPHAGRYVDGSEAHTPTREPVNAKDDEAFVAHECAWRLRCASYGGLRDMYLRMRDALIADGLHAPVRGGFVAAVDPRNGLHLASLPLYLLRGLYCLRDAMLYTCVHGALIGCNEHGALVVLVKHAYLCITDEWVLVMTEDGKAVRWQPLPQLEAVEYCTSEGNNNNNNNNRSSNYSESGHAKRPAASTFVALLASGAAADVVFHVTDAFTADTAAPSLFAAMPRTDMTAEVMRVLDVLRVLRQDSNNNGSGADSTTAATLRVVPVSSLSSAAASLSDAAAGSTSPVTTVRGYVERFAQTHTRALKWEALPAYADTHATLRSAAALAATLHVAAPSRQAVTRHGSFAAYYDEQPPASVEQALGSGVISGGHNNNNSSHNSSNNSGGGGAEHGDKDGGSGAFAARPPKKKLSRLLHSLYPNEAMY